VDDRPDSLPINHLVDHGTVVFRTGTGTKLLAAIRAEPVAFEVDGWDPVVGEAWSVVVKGKAEVIKRMAELLASTGWPLFPWYEGPKPSFVRVVPGEVTGRRFPSGGQGRLGQSHPDRSEAGTAVTPSPATLCPQARPRQVVEGDAEPTDS